VFIVTIQFFSTRLLLEGGEGGSAPTYSPYLQGKYLCLAMTLVYWQS